MIVLSTIESWLLVGVVLLVAAIVLEVRQARRIRRAIEQERRERIAAHYATYSDESGLPFDRDQVI